MSRGRADGEALAGSWVEHLRDGGTTPWPRWVRSAVDGQQPLQPTWSSTVPGAAQLELLRLLNEVGPVPHLADHVLGRPGPGRGPVHLALPLEQLGPPAPRREVLRVAAGVLADLTAQLPVARSGRRWGPASWLRGSRSRGRRPRPVEGLARFVLEGPPVTVAEVRARLAAAGMAEHRPRPTWRGPRDEPSPDVAVVLVAPLDEALRQAWAGRVQRGAGRAWPRFVAQWAGRGDLPPSVAVDRTVGYWADRLGPDNVHLLPLDPAGDPAGIPGRVAEVLGRPPGTTVGPQNQATVAAEEPVRLAPAAVDVLRRVNVVLPFVCPEPDQAARRAALVELLAEVDEPRRPVDLPRGQRDWADAEAGRLVEALQQGGGPVHGELDTLRTVGRATDRRLGGGEVLDVMVRMIHRVDAVLVEGRRDGRGGR